MNKSVLTHALIPALLLAPVALVPAAAPAHAATPAGRGTASWRPGNRIITNVTSPTLLASQAGKAVAITVDAPRGTAFRCSSGSIVGRAAAGTRVRVSAHRTCNASRISVTVAHVPSSLVGGTVQLAAALYVPSRLQVVSQKVTSTVAGAVYTAPLNLRRPSSGRRTTVTAILTSKQAPLASRATRLPRAAAAAGYTRRIFDDSFASLDTIDAGSGMSKRKWTTRLPWGQGRTPASKITKTPGGITIDQAWSNQNVALLTMDPFTGKGTTFGHGYFEATMRFDPKKGGAAEGFPAFWLLPKGEMYHQTRATHHGEIDIFEAFRSGTNPWGGTFAGTVHDVTPVAGKAWTYTSEQNTNNIVRAGIDGRWHRYGALWEPGRVRWFLDGRPIIDVAYGAHRVPSAPTRNWDTGTTNSMGNFSILEQNAKDGMVMMLGTAPHWPVEVGQVTVWAR